MKALLVVIGATLLFVSAAVAQNRKATLSVDPNPPVIGQVNTIRGCGYVPSTKIKVYIIWNADFESRGPWEGYDFNSATDAAGCLTEQWTPTSVGLYQIYVYQPNGGGWILTLRKSIEFEIR